MSAPFQSQESGNTVLAIAYKLSDSYAIVSNVYLNAIIEEIANRDDMYLYTEDGTILLAPYQDHIGKNIFTERPLYKQFSHREPELSYETELHGETANFTAFGGN
ncbi:hypothetical protein P4S72_21495 [Vibrio sp. PP-XX7]